MQPIKPTLNYFSLQMHPFTHLDQDSVQIKQEKQARPRRDFSGDAEDGRRAGGQAHPPTPLPVHVLAASSLLRLLPFAA